MVGGALSPEGKGFVPSGSLLDQAHLLPSLGRGLCPEGGPRNNGEGYVDKPVPKLLPTSPSSDQRGKVGGQRGKGMLGPELQLPLRRESGPRPSSLHLQPTPKLHLEVAGDLLRSSSPSGFPLEGKGCGGPRPEEPRPQDLF